MEKESVSPPEDFIDVKSHTRGSHKIFIGMAPGVGKTYRMLEEAQQLKEEGIDVVIGILETHGRKDTAEQAEGLEVVPRKQITWHGVSLWEMDPDAIIARQPQLVLVDELAHTNAPGSLREKRYQDVESILAAGIDVNSTVNIQHLESLNDLVARITKIIVRERIPDRLFEEADEIVLVDVTPETLEGRLQEGKIYAPEKVDQALQNFFQRRNLIALRELALREVADNIEEEREETLDPQKFQYYNIQERLLVCLSTNPSSIRLIRRGARLASYMNSRLYCLYVDNPDHFLTKEESLHVEICQNLCQEFGGDFLRVSDHYVAKSIASIATSYRITQIVLGQGKSFSRWRLALQGSMLLELSHLLQDVDLHIISTTEKT